MVNHGVQSPTLRGLVLLLVCAAVAAQEVIVMMNGMIPDEAVPVTPTDASLPGPAPSTSEQASAMHHWSRPSPSPSPAPQRPVLPTPPTKDQYAARSLNKTEDNSMFVQTSSYATVTQSTIVLDDVGTTQWFFNRPERKAGTIETGWLLQVLLMNKKERALNADITWVAGNGNKPRSATIMLWNPAYDSAKRRLSYSWAPLGAAANSDALLPSRGGSRSTLQSVSLFLDNCPSNVKFICCKGDSCNWFSSCKSGGNAVYMRASDGGGPQIFSCPTNWVGVVRSNACFDSHSQAENNSGSCVACDAGTVQDKCESEFPEECANGGCSHSWYPGYWPYFCNFNPTNTPNAKYGSCQCGGVDLASSTVQPDCSYECPTSALWCSAL